MMLSGQPLSFRVFGYFVLLALCAILLLHHFHTISIPRVVSVSHSQPPPESPSEPPSEPQTSEGIPKLLWYKLGPHGLSDDTREWTDSCINANPDYRAEFMTDDTADEYVKKAFASRPDIVELYLGLTVPILKADMLRYLLLYDHGGVYSDLDVSCEGIPIDSWIPEHYKNETAVVVGWEFDVGYTHPFTHQFVSWIIMAKPRSPHMLQVIDDIVEAMHKVIEEHNVSVGQIEKSMVGDVVDFTGPRRLTTGVLKSLSRTLNRNVETDQMSENLQPQLYGDVLVMPGRSFAESMNKYSDEELQKVSPKLVTHHYAGTWKNDQGGETV